MAQLSVILQHVVLLNVMLQPSNEDYSKFKEKFNLDRFFLIRQSLRIEKVETKI